MKKKFYWKVCYRKGKAWGSSNYALFPGILRTYSFKTYTHPTVHALRLGYGLCVFRTRVEARKFWQIERGGPGRMGRFSLRVFKCRAKNVRKPTVGMTFDHSHHYAIATGGYLPASSDAWPDGTLHADAVKLIK